MIKRNLKAKFSAFFQVKESQKNLWITNVITVPKLAKNFDNLLSHNSESDEDYFAKYFVKQVLENPLNQLDKEHLSAYFEEPCLWLAQEMKRELVAMKLTQLECFLCGRKFAAETKIFKKYDFESSSVKTWGKMQIRSAIKDEVYRDSEIPKYKNWALLRHISKKIFKEALQRETNQNQREIENHILAVYAYKKIYTNKGVGNQELPEPNQQDWENITSYYHQLCINRQQEVVADYREVRQQLLECVRAARNFYKKIEPTDTPVDRDITEIADNKFNNSPLEAEIKTEDLKQINLVLLSEFSDLSLEYQKILRLFYGLGISQTEIAKILKLRQYQISRLVKKCEYKMLVALNHWSQENLGRSLNEQMIQEQNEHLKEWLKDHFLQHFYLVLQENIVDKQKDKIMILRLFYGEQLKSEIVAERLGISQQTVTEKIAAVKQELQTYLRQWVWENLEIPLPDSAEKSIAKFIEEWLEAAPYATFNLAQ